jgi:hypothetical protein
VNYLVAHYLPTALFSLKDSQATNAAGKTLLVPSPYAIKMALLDVAAGWRGAQNAQDELVWLRSLEVRQSPPKYACVTNAFIKIQRPPKHPMPFEPFKPTIAFREYAQFHGELRLAFDTDQLDPAQLETLRQLLIRINYFGKRGGFMQFTALEILESLDASFTHMTGDTHASSGSVMHYLDDFSSKTTWAMVNIYDKKSASRQIRPALIPYQLKRSSKRSSLYERLV